MNLHVLPAGMLETNAYLLALPERAEALLIDAPDGIWGQIEPILAKERCQLQALWLTHGHFDHMQGAAEVVRRTKARVVAHADDRVLIETPEAMGRFMNLGLEIEPVHVDQWVKQGDRLEVLGSTAEVRHVPGHCPGNVLYYFAAMKAAFVGDALFAGSVGRTDLPGGGFEMLERSIREQIYTLPDETVVYPGHGRDTTVGAEKATNPYVAG